MIVGAHLFEAIVVLGEFLVERRERVLDKLLDTPVDLCERATQHGTDEEPSRATHGAEAQGAVRVMPR